MVIIYKKLPNKESNEAYQSISDQKICFETEKYNREHNEMN
jgi:hypothetical protein